MILHGNETLQIKRNMFFVRFQNVIGLQHLYVQRSKSKAKENPQGGNSDKSMTLLFFHLESLSLVKN